MTRSLHTGLARRGIVVCGAATILLIGAAAAVVFLGNPVSAQQQQPTTPQIPQDILEGLFPGTTQQPSQEGTQQEPGTTAPTGGRQPINENQFISARSGALQQRRPGLYIQQAIAVHNGDTTFFTGVPEEPPNFFRDTFDQIVMNVLDVFGNVLTGINTFITSLGGTGGTTPGGTTFVNPPNAVTTWGGTSQTIP